MRGDLAALSEIPQAELRDAAWAVLEALAERRDPKPVARRALARLAKDRDLSDADAEALASLWLEHDGPLACVREEGVSSRGWFTAEQTRELVAAAREDGANRALAKSVWRYLVRHGWSPTDARLAAWGWSPESGTLPNGQWIPPEVLASSATRAPNQVLSNELVDQVMGLLAHSQVRALARVREATGASLEEAQALLEALAERKRTGADDASAARAAVDEAIRGLMLDRPFHWALLDAAHVVEDASVATMAVGITVAGNIALFYAPSFVLGLGLEQRKGVLLHEVHHVIFDHLHPPPEATSATAWTLACEVTANEWVPYELPNPITLDDVGLPPGESTRDRYARLVRRKKLAPDWGPKLRGAEKDRIVRTLAARPRSHDDYAVGPRSAKNALEAAAARVRDELDPETRRMLGAAELAALELGAIGRSTLAWHELLRILARGLVVRTSTRTYPSRRLPSKLGIAPGRRARRTRPVVMAVVDTSASMSTGELAQVSAELARLVRAHVRVACVQCDDTIRKREWLAEGAVLTRVHGRGGTDLRPPLSPAEIRKVRPDLVVYFTDGHGPAPSAAPRGVEVLWVLTGSSPRVPARFGRVVRMRERGHVTA